MLLKLAFKNIFRNFKRTFLTLMAIAFGIMILIVMDSMLSGMDKDSFMRVINYETGHIKIFKKGYQEEKEELPLDISIGKPNRIIKQLKNDPDVAGVTSRINFRVMLSDGIDQFPAVGFAINTSDDESVFLLKQAVEKGEYLSGNEEAMLLGEGLADDFGVGVGDYLTVLTRTKYETYQALDLRIKGILRTEDPKIDWAAVVIPMGLAQDSLDMGGSVTEIDIKLKNPKEMNAIRERIAQDLTGVEIFTWKELAEDVVAISQSKRGGTIMIFGSVVLIALMGISNTILLAAFERTKEIGMIAAMGMKRKDIVRLFVLEGAIIGFFGSIVGCVFGILLNIPIVNKGINYGATLRDMGDIGYRLTSVMYGTWRPGMIVTALIFGFVVSALVSIYPARVASRMEPTEALKKV